MPKTYEAILGNRVIGPRLLTREQAAAYCSLSVQAFSAWVRAGRLPPALPGTSRWDKTAIDIGLDKASGLLTAARQKEDVFDEWKNRSK